MLEYYKILFPTGEEVPFTIDPSFQTIEQEFYNNTRVEFSENIAYLGYSLLFLGRENMTPNEYIKNTKVTDLTRLDYDLGATDRAASVPEMTHYILGTVTEAAELADALKKYIAYGKPLDLVNIKEETGDLLWYLARICDLNNWTFEEVMELNINKLKARYGEKFTADAALNRDLDIERKVLEK